MLWDEISEGERTVFPTIRSDTLTAYNYEYQILPNLILYLMFFSYWRFLFIMHDKIRLYTD